MTTSLARTWFILAAVAACSGSGQQLGVHEDASGGKSTGSGGKAQAGAGGVIDATGGVVNGTGGTPNASGASGVVNAAGGAMSAAGGTINAAGGTLNASGTGGTINAAGGTLNASGTGGTINATGGTVGSGGHGGGPGVLTWGGNGSTCIGTIEEVNAVWTCPATYCAAKAWAINWCSLGKTYSEGYETRCGNLTQVTVRFLPGVGCGYRGNRLASNQTWKDLPQFCGNTTNVLQSAEWDDSCNQRVATYCEMTTGAAGSAGSAGAAGVPAIPDANCYNNVTSNCLPCCPAAPPDCGGKPDGYPGYKCTPAPAGGGGGAAGSPSSASSCDCDCRAGQWKCDCAIN